jgi:hypothetical protein
MAMKNVKTTDERSDNGKEKHTTHPTYTISM